MNYRSERLPPAERVEAYKAALRSYFACFDMPIEVRVTTGAPEHFSAHLQHLRIGRLHGALHASNSPHVLQAAAGPEENRGTDLYFLRQGRLTLEGACGVLDLCAGDMALVSANAEFVAHAGTYDMLAIGLPKELLRLPHIRSRQLALKLDTRGTLAACLGAQLRVLAEQGAQLLPGEGAVLQAALLDSVHQLAAENPAETLTARQHAQLQKVKGLALQWLAAPDLTPAGLAHEACISLRTLHRLFALSGETFCDWLREARLERCWQELTAPRSPVPTIAAIAFGWGFSDLRTFNRAFAARYGVTPTQARSAGKTPPPARQSIGPS